MLSRETGGSIESWVAQYRDGRLRIEMGGYVERWVATQKDEWLHREMGDQKVEQEVNRQQTRRVNRKLVKR